MWKAIIVIQISQCSNNNKKHTVFFNLSPKVAFEVGENGDGDRCQRLKLLDFDMWILQSPKILKEIILSNLTSFSALLKSMPWFV